ncbi:MAG: hypothetical protein Q7V05_08515 [Methanoregula sp.]|nr:hypothetical protein [Methanoregula sp.]
MTPQQGTKTSPIMTVLAGTLQEILNTLYRKYPDEVQSACTGKGAHSSGNPADLEDLILRYSGDEEINEILARRFKECGLISDSIPESASPLARQRYDLYSDLDEGSRTILGILYEQRYATLDELSACSGLTHYAVLHRLREIIIPMSVKRRGRPIAVFCESATDLATGRQIVFSWWLNDDLLHKKKEVEVVETSDSLVITLDRTGCDLPKTPNVSASCTHGILEIKVEKNPDEPCRSGKGKRNVGLPAFKPTGDDLVTGQTYGHESDDSRFHNKNTGGRT